MLKNEPFVDKLRFDTIENELSGVEQLMVTLINVFHVFAILVTNTISVNIG